MRFVLLILSHLLRLAGAVSAAVGALLVVMWVVDSGSPANSGELMAYASIALAVAAGCVRTEIWLSRSRQRDTITEPQLLDR